LSAGERVIETMQVIVESPLYLERADHLQENMKRICVFAGSNVGSRPEYRAQAAELGRALAARGIGVVYGGARVGLMGALADAVLAAGREVIGVIPAALVEKHGIEEGFVRREYRGMISVAESAEVLLNQMATYEAPRVEKWIEHVK
jgi:predicted Rossmann-fold nucleotide-binding protein